MKILYVLHQYLPRYFTGTEQYAHAVALWMRAQGHAVEVFALEPQFGEGARLFVAEDEIVDGLPVTRVHYWQHLHADREHLEYEHPYLGWRFGQALDAIRPDVVHFFHLRFLGGNLIDEARSRDIKSVVHLMDFWFLCPRVTLVRGDGSLCAGPPRDGLRCVPCTAPELEREIDAAGQRERMAAAFGRGLAPQQAPGASAARRAATLLQRHAILRARLLAADRIVAPSRFLRSVFADHGIDAERITVIPYGVDMERTPHRATARPLTLGYVGTIAPHKGLHVLLDALQQVDGDVRLAVHGRTSDFADYAQPLETRARADARIAFHGPFAAAARARVLAGIDVLVVPSQWHENTPFVALEALAAGIPVLAADLGGLAEIVADETNGERFRHADAADLARRIRRLLAEPERLARYRAGIAPPRTLADSARDIEALYAGLQAVRA